MILNYLKRILPFDQTHMMSMTDLVVLVLINQGYIVGVL